MMITLLFMKDSLVINMRTLKFTKMHGLGNDFMVIDAIHQVFHPESAPIATWANRHTGIGFDQLLLVESPRVPQADFRYRIFNADGTEVEQCGNGARCFVRFVVDKGLTEKKTICVETAGGLITPQLMDDDLVSVDMGLPVFEPERIPFIAQTPINDKNFTYSIVLPSGSIEASCVSMGNPHVVLLVDDIDAAPVETLGPLLESHWQFPQKVNVGFMQIVDNQHIYLRVYERGVGETQACGTGACAAVVAGIRKNMLAANCFVEVTLPGGCLKVRWQESKCVTMMGPAEMVFDGEVVYS